MTVKGPTRVLMLVDGYPSPENPVDSVFLRDQAIALSRCAIVGVVQAKTCSPRQWLSRGRSMPQDHVDCRDGIPVYQMESFVGTTRVMQLLVSARMRSLERAMRQFEFEYGRPDVIHAHCAAFAGETAVQYGRSRGIPVVVTEHYSFLPELMLHYGRRLLKVYEQADGVLAVSSSLAQRMRDLGICRSIQVMPNAVDDATFSPAPVAVRAGNAWELLCVASDREVKDLRTLVYALAALPADLSFRLTLAGPGEYRTIRELLCSQGLENRVHFVGALQRAKLAEQMRRSHLILSSSRVETFGMTLAESLCVGRPVVSTDSGGPRDIVRPQDGRLVPVGDAAALSAAVVDLLSHYEQYDQAAIAAAARRRFGFTAFAQTMTSYYDEICQSYSRTVELAACG